MAETTQQGQIKYFKPIQVFNGQEYPAITETDVATWKQDVRLAKKYRFEPVEGVDLNIIEPTKANKKAAVKKLEGE